MKMSIVPTNHKYYIQNASKAEFFKRSIYGMKYSTRITDFTFLQNKMHLYALVSKFVFGRKKIYPI